MATRSQREIERATAEGLEDVGSDFVSAAFPLTPVDEGDLRRSTRAERVREDRDGLSIEMGSFDQGHAIHVERGTAKTEGQFMYQRAADKTWRTLPDRIKAAMRSPAA